MNRNKYYICKEKARIARMYLNGLISMEKYNSLLKEFN